MWIKVHGGLTSECAGRKKHTRATRNALTRINVSTPHKVTNIACFIKKNPSHLLGGRLDIPPMIFETFKLTPKFKHLKVPINLKLKI